MKLRKAFYFVAALIAIFPATSFAADHQDIHMSLGGNEGGAAMQLGFGQSNDHGQRIGGEVELGNARRMTINLDLIPNLKKQDGLTVRAGDVEWLFSNHGEDKSASQRKIELFELNNSGEKTLANDLKLRTEIMYALVHLRNEIDKGEKSVKKSGIGHQIGVRSALQKKLSDMTTAELILTAKLADTFNEGMDPTTEVSGEFLFKKLNGVYSGLRASSKNYGAQGVKEHDGFVGVTVGRAF